MSDITETLSSMKNRLSSAVSPGATSTEQSSASTDPSSTPGTGWTEVPSPTGKSLYGVVDTVKGPYAVGTDGNVLHRSGGGWRVVIADGPAAKRNTLTCVAATSDGTRIWFAGSSGALGMYDAVSGRKYDHTAPKGKTSTWEAIAVGGPRGEEQLRVANGSGEVLSATVGADGCPAFGDVVKPGSGSTIAALDYAGDAFFAIDTSGNVFEEADGKWSDIGIENAQVNFFDVNATPDSLLVSGGSGRVYRYDRACTNWTPVSAGTGALHSLARDGEVVVAVGANGNVFERRPDAGWRAVESPVSTTLRSVSLGRTDVAVGSGGTIIERA